MIVLYNDSLFTHDNLCYSDFIELDCSPLHVVQ